MFDFLSLKWLWLYLGAGLMFLEILAPGFVIFFFGLAAATVGVALFVAPEISLTLQVVLFTALSIVYLLTLRRLVKSVFTGDTAATGIDEYAGRLGTVKEAIAPGAPGRVELGEVEWTAAAEEPLAAGTKVRVVSRNNLTLTVARV